MVEHVDTRYYAVVDEKPKGVSKEDYDKAKDKLSSVGKKHEAPNPQAKNDVVANDRPAADADTIAESQKDEPAKRIVKK